MNKLWVVRKQPYRETSALLTVLLGENRLIRCIAGSGKVSEFQPLFGVLADKKGSLVYRRLNRQVRRCRLGRRTYQRLYMNEIMHDDSRGRRGREPI